MAELAMRARRKGPSQATYNCAVAWLPEKAAEKAEKQRKEATIEGQREPERERA